MNAQFIAIGGRPASRASVILRLTLLTLAIASLLWTTWNPFGAFTVLVSLLLLLVVYWWHQTQGVSLRQIGFRWDTAAAAAAPLTMIAAVAIATTLAIGAGLDSWHFPATASGLGTWLNLVLFGIAQQYVLLGFYYRAIASIMRTPAAALLSTAALFAAFHAPNAFLMAVTFLAALLAIYVYRRSPNLWVIGIAHGSISFTLYYALPVGLTHGLRVGSSYYQ